MACTVTGKGAAGVVRADCKPSRVDGIPEVSRMEGPAVLVRRKTKSAPFSQRTRKMEHSGQKTLAITRIPRGLNLVVPDDVGLLRRFVGFLQDTCRIAQRGDLRR